MGGMEDNVRITSKVLRAEAKRVGGCGAELSRLGPATDQLQAVFVLAQQGCAKYESAGKCFAAAARSFGSSGEKCLAPFNRAIELFSIAGVTAEAVKDSVN